MSLQLAFASCPPRIDSDELMTPILRNFMFERVWQTVNDHYLYEDFGGLDWQTLKAQYREQILTVSNNQAFYTGVDDMIYALNDDHSVYLSPWDSCAEDGWEIKPDSETQETNDDIGPILTFSRLEQHKDILFIELDSFDSETVDERFTTELRNALREGDVSTVIIDLRHNYGGYLESTFNILQHFVHGKIGFEVDKEGHHPIISFRTPYFRKLENVEVIVFVDNESHSAAELTAGILQLERGATVIGTTASAGNTEIVLPFDFRDGSRLWLAVSSFRLRDGTNLEGRGVIPDVLIKPEDDFLEAALKHLMLEVAER